MGSAVMGPEVYLKALSMARNVAHQEGRKIANFTTAAFDLIPIQRRLAGRSAEVQSAVLLSSLENHPRPHRRRRRAKLLCLRRSPADGAVFTRGGIDCLIADENLTPRRRATKFLLIPSALRTLREHFNL